MTKRRLFIFFAAVLLIFFAVFTFPFQVGSVRGERLLQTWPSRTPTPQGGPQPTATNQGPPPTTDPGGGPNPTAQPGATNTPVTDEAPPLTPSATVVLATPEGGYVATAQPCGVLPTVQARGLVNVRQGPGLDYEPIDTLIYLEVRPIIGRGEFATWWLIQLPGNDTGWVADQAVSVQGYTGNIPVVDPPALDGATPTPGPTWEPTPNPVCTPLPTPTATIEPTVEEADVTTVSVSTNATPTEAPPEPTNTPTEEPATEPAPSDTPQATVTSAPATPTTNAAIIDTSEPPIDDSGDSGASASSWILFIGIGLLVVGAASYIFSRR
jgi:hypothetical protein